MVKKKFNKTRYLAILSAVTIGGVIVSYYLAATSDALRTAESFLSTNTSVVKKLGRIKSSRLGLNYSIKYRGKEGVATLKVILNGELESGDAYVKLETVDGIWLIKVAELAIDHATPIDLLQE